MEEEKICICKEDEGEHLSVLSEHEFKHHPYVEKSWYRKLFLGGFCYPARKAIIIRESRKDDILLLCHERGHLKGCRHTWRWAYIMFPYAFGRGRKV